MNKTYTLKELADIGAKHAYSCLDGHFMQCNSGVHNYDEEGQKNARLAFTKAVLDAIGYEFPKDEEREAFERWQTSVGWDLRDSTFEAWKAGREELRRVQMTAKDQPEAVKPKYHYRGTKLENISFEKEPAWIPWEGGECPLADTVKRWEYRMRNGKTNIITNLDKMSEYWSHEGLPGDIVAYRVLEG